MFLNPSGEYETYNSKQKMDSLEWDYYYPPIKPGDAHLDLSYLESKEKKDSSKRNTIPMSVRYVKTESDNEDVYLNYEPNKENINLIDHDSEQQQAGIVENVFTNFISTHIKGNAILITAVVSQLVSFFLYLIGLWNLEKWNKRITSAIISQFIGIIATFSVIFKFKFDKQQFVDVITTAQEVKETKTYEQHVAFLNMHVHSRQEIIDYLKKNYLCNKFDLPVCSYHELKQQVNRWVWEKYTDSFIAAWYGRNIIEIFKQRPVPVKPLLVKQAPSYIKSLVDFLQRILGILLSWIFTLVEGKSFSRADIRDGIMIGNTFSTCTGDIVKDVLSVFDDSSDVLTKQIAKYTTDLDKFLETPNYEFSNNLRYVYDIREELVEINDFIAKVPQDKKSLVTPLLGLHCAASKRKNEILNTMCPEFSRQETFVLLLQGPGAIGKTVFCQHLGRKIASELIPDGEVTRDYIEIRHDDKYWPPLSGQRVAFFDEAGTVKNIDEDLLFRNIKGICSPAYFNCPAADLEHKITPCPFHVIIATTNTTFDKIQTKYSSFAGADSVYSMWRRVIPIGCSWNGPPLDLNNPSGHKEDFSHLNFTKYKWDPHTAKLVPDRDLGPEQIYSLIEDKYKEKYSAHVKSVNVQRAQRQSEHVMHYTVHMHGPPGQGKTPNINKLAFKLSETYRMPIEHVETLEFFKIKRLKQVPTIFVFDDVFDNKLSVENQQFFMHIYNKIIPNNSILLISSNIKTTYHFIPTLKMNNFYFDRKLGFDIPGVIKRLGFTGDFQGVGTLPGYNKEYYCKNEVFHKCEVEPIKNSILALSIISIIGIYYTWFSLIGLVPLLYSFRRLHSRTPIPNLLEDVYDGYRQFLSMRHNVDIQYVNELPELQYNLKIKIPNKQNFKVPENLIQLDKHVTLSLNVFEKEHDNWMMYFDRVLADKLKCVYHRFFINDSLLSDQVITRELIRCSKTILEYGIQPTMSIVVNGIGQYAFHRNTVYKVIPEEGGTDMFVMSTPTMVVISSTDRFVEIPFRDVFGNVNVPIKYELNLLEAIEFSKYVRSEGFLSLDYVRKYLVKQQHDNIKVAISLKYKEIADKIKELSSKPFGKKKRQIKSKEETDSEEEEQQDNSKGKKKKRNPKYYSDPEDQGNNTDQDNSKGKKKKRNPKYYSDVDEPQTLKSFVASRQGNNISKPSRQDVKTLCDMNDYDAYKKYIESAYIKAKKAMSMVYLVASDEEVLHKEPVSRQSCYALFVKKNIFVTVGHVAKEVKGYYNLYVGNDDFKGSFYRCKMLRTYKTRDLSFWSCEIPFQFPDITGNFLLRRELYATCFVNAALERYAPGKEPVWIQGACEIIEPFYAIDEDGIQEFGYVDFATFGIQLTYYGDCGLPYYAVERTFWHNKILGIHCMGNIDGYSSIGIMALIVKEDFIGLESQSDKCKFCAIPETRLNPASEPKCDLHEIVWNGNHESSAKTFVEELRHHDEVRPAFSGLVIKNSGPIMRGSVEHSHTQFLTNVHEQFIVTKGWQTATATELGFDSALIEPNSTFSYRVIDVPYGSLYGCLNNIGYARNFRLYADVYNHNAKRKALIKIIIPAAEQLQINDLPRYGRQALVPLTLEEGRVVHVDGDVFDAFQQHINRYKRGMLPDIPYEDISDNQTVRVIGVTHRDMSPLPGNAYVPTPFHSRIGQSLGPHKVPVRFDSENAPPEQLKKLATDRCGNPHARITCALPWAHPDYCPTVEIRRFVKSEYMSNILENYSNLNLLTDKQLFHGYEIGHRLRGALGPLEIDSSIGWTLKQIFNVTKKSDIVSVSSEGEYTWKDNECAEFARAMLDVSKMQAEAGVRYWTVFNELLKMEKLKPEKQFLPRSFTANDFNGVLMERLILGEFTARAMKWDETVAVGMNVYSDFNRLTMDLSKFKNQFTIDYTRWDRTIPASVFEDIRDLLIMANPHLKNHLTSCFETIIERIQVSGNTVAMVRGGMPSGCIPTAPLNSKCNDYVIYTIYVQLCWDSNNHDLAYYAMYNKLVKRRFYGDDGWLSVDDSIKDFFNCTTLVKYASKFFGMTITPGSKNGIPQPFEDFEQISFISRFPRKLDSYEFFVGALKKISIVTHFHFAIDASPAQLGSQLMLAQSEAALWEPEFFQKVQDKCREAIAICPKIKDHFSFYTRSYLQKLVFEGAYTANVGYQVTKDDPLCLRENMYQTPKSCDYDYKDTLIAYKRRSEQHNYKKFCKRLKKTDLDENSDEYQNMSVFSSLNELFQRGIITKPITTYAIQQDLKWKCEIRVTLAVSGTHIIKDGFGPTKSFARECASQKILDVIGGVPEEHVTKRLFARQMNVSKGVEHRTPGAALIAPDPSVTPDSGIVTNTVTPSPCRIINPGAISLDNPAGTGAAFDKRDAVYGIYHRWGEKSATVNGSQTEGTEVLRISLDPSTLPNRIREYILFHEYIIPAIDVQIVIGGAAGTIGWLKLGWVPDDSKKYSLDDLQQVASETINMNGTITMSTLLTDNRQYGMYRKVKGDTEKWPALVLMVEHPALNVQRNDDVGYPVRVNVRLSPACVLMYPNNTLTPGNIVGTKISLQNYLATNAVDFLIGSSKITNISSYTKHFPDCGWNTGKFIPQFQQENFIGLRLTSHPTFVIQLMKNTQFTYPRTTNQKVKNAALIPLNLVFAYGDVPADAYGSVQYRGSSFDLPDSTIYNIPDYYLRSGGLKYKCNTLRAYDGGCILSFEVDGKIARTKVENDGTFTIVGIDGNAYQDAVLIVNDDQDRLVEFPLISTEGQSQVSRYVWLSNGKEPSLESGNFPSFYPTDNKIASKFNTWEITTLTPSTRFYNWVYTQTGNSIPSESLPTGLKTAYIVRPGTTSSVSNDTPFVPINAPGIKTIYSILNEILDKDSSTFLVGDLRLKNENLGKIGYIKDAFLVRTTQFRRIKTALSTELYFENITAVENISNLTPLSLTGFDSWSNKPSLFTGRTFARQAMVLGQIAAGAASGLFGAISSGLSQWQYQNWKDEQQKRNNELMAQLEMMRTQSYQQVELLRNQGNLDAIQKRHDLRLQDLGYGSVSTQSGNIDRLETQSYYSRRPGIGLYKDTSDWNPAAHLQGVTTGESSTDPEQPNVGSQQTPTKQQQQRDVKSLTLYDNFVKSRKAHHGQNDLSVSRFVDEDEEDYPITDVPDPNPSFLHGNKGNS